VRLGGNFFFSSSFLSHLNLRHFGNKLQKEIKKKKGGKSQAKETRSIK
jgi:hypothetical protein